MRFVNLKHFLLFFVCGSLSCQQNTILNKKHGARQSNVQFVGSGENSNTYIQNQTTESSFTILTQTRSNSYLNPNGTESSTDISTDISTLTCTPPSIYVSSMCYSNYNMITSSTDCETAGGYYTGGSNGVTCYQSISVIPQTACTGLNLYFSNGICYSSQQAATDAATCFSNNGIYINDTTTSTNCLASFNLVDTQTDCNSSLMNSSPSTALWIPTKKVCVQSVASITNATDCAAVGGTWTTVNPYTCTLKTSTTGTQSATNITTQTTSATNITTQTTSATNITTQTTSATNTTTQTTSATNTTTQTTSATNTTTQTTSATNTTTQTTSATNTTTKTTTATNTTTKTTTATNTTTQTATATKTATVTLTNTSTITNTSTSTSTVVSTAFPSNFKTWGPANQTFVADMDGDGYPDIVTVNTTTKLIYILSNNLGKGFTAKSYPLGNWGDNDNISTLDFVGAGRASIATYSSTSKMLYIYYLSCDKSKLHTLSWPINYLPLNGSANVYFGIFNTATKPGPSMMALSTAKSASTGYPVYLSLNAYTSAFTTPACSSATVVNAPSTTTKGFNFSTANVTQLPSSTYGYVANIAGTNTSYIVNTEISPTWSSTMTVTTPVSYSQKSCGGYLWGPSGLTFIGTFFGGNTFLDLVSLLPSSIAPGWSFTRAYYSLATGCFTYRMPVTPNVTLPSALTANRAFSGDFNADKKTDLLFLTQNSVYVAYSQAAAGSEPLFISIALPSGFTLPSNASRYLPFSGTDTTMNSGRGVNQTQRGYAFSFNYNKGVKDHLVVIDTTTGIIYVLGIRI